MRTGHLNLEMITITSISGVLPPCILGRPDCCTSTSAMFFSEKSCQEWTFSVLLYELVISTSSSCYFEFKALRIKIYYVGGSEISFSILPTVMLTGHFWAKNSVSECWYHISANSFHGNRAETIWGNTIVLNCQPSQKPENSPTFLDTFMLPDSSRRLNHQ